MQPEAVARLLDDWAARLARGEQPDPQPYLDEAGAAAGELAGLLEAFLDAAPRRDPEPETVELVHAWASGDAPLVALRARRGLRRDDLVDAVVAEFAHAPGKRAIVKRYVHRLEAGLIEPRGLSAPLLELLTRTLRVPARTILAARARPVPAAPAFRLQASAAPDRLMIREPEEDDEQVAALFLSGP
jgi:hypothetical protein